MRHGVVSRRFDRPIGYRQMMFRNLVTEILDHEKIKTTEPKAKAVRGMTEKMITLAKDRRFACSQTGYVFYPGQACC